MKALQIDSFGGLQALAFKNIQAKEPLDDEVQIQIAYAAINPVDWKISEGVLKNVLPHEFPITLGWDAAGTIAKVGKNVEGFKVGDPVFAYCRKNVVHDGTFAEYITYPAKDVAHKPKTLSLQQAASIPLCALTAYQALFDVGKLKENETLLITGGAGGVGSIALPLAKWAKANVITTASEKNHPYVLSRGAKWAIDYNKGDFVQEVKKIVPEGVDFVFDCVGGDTQKSSFNVLKPGGRLVSIVESPDQALAKQYGVFAHHVFVRPNGKELTAIADLIDKGLIQIPAIQQVPFDQAIEWLRFSKKGHTQGKIVLAING